MMEDEIAQGREERGQASEKRKWEGPPGPVRPFKPFTGEISRDSRREVRWSFTFLNIKF